MVKLTLQCSRCGEEFVQDVTGDALNDDVIRKFGFTYMVVKGKTLLICHPCEKEFRELKEKLEVYVHKAECEFFDTCGKDKDGNNNGAKNG